ncbi:MAG: 23S rRNA (uracil(1939)-C(5))-methyltransferase RlmD [Christensenellales bacterium]
MNLRPPIEKNDDIELTITALSSEGQGIGRIDGYAVFVPYALAGERVRAHVIKVTSGYAVAKLTDILEKSADRTENTCPSYPKCGGCTLRHLAYPAQLEAKTAQVRDALIRLGKFDAPAVLPCIGMDDPAHYRNKGSFPMGYGEGFKVTPGFFAQRSHRLIPVESCEIQSPEVMAVTAVVAEWANMYGIPPYDEYSRTGALRHVMARSSEEGVLALVVTTGRLPHSNELVEALKRSIPRLVGVVHNINSKDTNVILGNKFITLWGNDRLNTRIAGHSFSASMASFLQVNPIQTEKLYGCALEFLSLNGDERVADVYCGIGTITLMLAEHCAYVTGIECVPAAIADAKANAAKNGISNVEFICDTAESALPTLVEEGMRLDAAVIDPPRKGCERPALDALADSGVERIVYVSCNPATMARDCRVLADRGYELIKAQPVDMFPNTHHVETVCLLVRRNSLHIDIDVDVEEMLQEKRGQATYPQIKEYVLEHSGLKVSSLYISQIKRKCGLDVGDSYNKPKSEDAVQPQCPPEKEEAIKEALKYFGMI